MVAEVARPWGRGRSKFAEIFFWDPGTGPRAHSPKPPFYKTALLLPLDLRQTCRTMFRSGIPD